MMLNQYCELCVVEREINGMTTNGQEEEPHDAFEVVTPEIYASSQYSHRLVDLILVYKSEECGGFAFS
jgi:hypothetical protein